MKYVSTVFGLMLDYDVPEGCDMVVLCVDLHQHVPLTVLLPHQVYRERLQELVAKYPEARSFTIIPCRSGEKLTVPLAKVCG